MNAYQGLILAMYALLGGVLLLAGFIYKEIRSFRNRRKNPTFNFPPIGKSAASEKAQDSNFVASR